LELRDGIRCEGCKRNVGGGGLRLLIRSVEMPIEPEMGSLVEVLCWGVTECAGDGTVEENFRGPYPLGNKLIVSAPGCETRKSNTAYLYYD
jgi:hypothetical protein